jgi:BirA family transcriptional regulator, biotin operon repressor / biotin---[acetyl-CoA-carboxylase] ligase
MSLIFRPVIPPERTYRLVMASALALAEACEALSGVPVGIKWPNDVQIGGKKLAGILAESAVAGAGLAWVIVGVGVNVNQIFAPGDPLTATATSLRMSAGREFDRLALLSAFLEGLNGWHERLLDDALMVGWRARCVTLGRRVRVVVGGQQALEGLAEDIDADGALLLRDQAGVRHTLAAGEATLLAE